MDDILNVPMPQSGLTDEEIQMMIDFGNGVISLEDIEAPAQAAAEQRGFAHLNFGTPPYIEGLVRAQMKTLMDQRDHLAELLQKCVEHLEKEQELTKRTLKLIEHFKK